MYWIRSKALATVVATLAVSLSYAQSAKEPYHDYLVQSYPAQMTTELPGWSLSQLPKTMPCQSSPVVSLLQSILDVKPDSRTVYVFHIAKWESRSGIYALKKSQWYVYHQEHAKLRSGNFGCTLRQTGYQAGGTPLIYGNQRVWLIGISYFDSPVPPGSITLGYKLANVPIAPQNVQDLGALIVGALGATVPSTASGGATETIEVSAEAPKLTSYITVGRFDFMKHVPQSLSFSFSMAANQIGSLPNARIGVPYAGIVSASGGNGSYVYEIVHGSLPPGLGLDKVSGTISGTPIAGSPDSYDFYIRALDTSKPPNQATVEASIALNNSIMIQTVTVPPTGPSGSALTFPDARSGSPYDVLLVPSAATGSSSQYTFLLDSGKSVNADWATLSSATGLISGTPTNCGPLPLSSQFSINLQDQTHSGQTIGPYTANLNILPQLSDMRSMGPSGRMVFEADFTSSPSASLCLPEAFVNHMYTIRFFASFAASAGYANYTYSLDLSHSTNANWITVSPQGVLSGTPSIGGPTTVTVLINDPKHPGTPIGKIDATVPIWPTASNPSAVPLPNATLGRPYVTGMSLGSLASATLTASGDLPDGITLNPATGEIAGTATNQGDVGRTFYLNATVSTPSSSPGNLPGQKTFLLSLAVDQPSGDALSSSTFPRVSVDFTNGGALSGDLDSTAAVGSPFNLSLSLKGPNGKYLVFAQCRDRRPRTPQQALASAGCEAARWLDIPSSITLTTPTDKVVPTTDGNSISLEGIPWESGSVNLVITVCKESARSLSDQTHAKKDSLAEYSQADCDSNFTTIITETVNIAPTPLQALTLSLGAGSPQSPSSSLTKAGPSQQTQAAPSSSPQSGGKNNGASNSAQSPSNSGKPSGSSNSNAPQATSPTNPQAVDCSAVNAQTPCALAETFVNNDRESFDFSIGVNVPGVREAKYTVVYETPTNVTHTDLYALVDLYPLALVQKVTHWSAIAYMPSKESWIPHLNVGIPIASRPFYRPYFGLAEDLTTWTRLERLGFPIRINAFAGFVLMKQQIVSGSSSASPSLIYDRGLKPMFGIEVPISALTSKISSALTPSKSSSPSAK